MDSKMQDSCSRLIDSKGMGTTLKSKAKQDRVWKEHWDSLCAVYEDEAKTRLQKMKDNDENIPDYYVGLPRHTKNDLSISKRVKQKNLKNKPPIEHTNIKPTQTNEKNEGKIKFKDLEKKTLVNEASLKDFSRENAKEVPSVIVLHKYKKGIFKSKTEPKTDEVISSHKAVHRLDKSGKKINAEEISSSEKNVLIDEKNLCKELKNQSRETKFEGKHSLDSKHQFKDKSRKKRDKGAVYKTLSTNFESKLRKKRKKLERQQILKEVVSTLNADKDIYEKIKSLPIKIDENQLIFMHPSHVAKAVENFKTKKNIFQERVNADSICNVDESKCKSINKEKSKTSLTKQIVDKNSSSKKLKVFSSIKKFKKSIPIGLEEKSEISLIKVSRHKKDAKKRRSKFTSNEKNHNIQEELNNGEESKIRRDEAGSNLMTSENSSKAHFSVTRQNVCFGDNSVDVCKVKHNKLPTILSGSLRSKSNKFNKVGSNLKNGPVKELKIRKINQKEMEKLKALVKRNDESENDVKVSTSDVENKLSFQLSKKNTNPKSIARLKKNVYSVSDRMGSKENIEALQNDRLYVTKRMLFYTNRESSSTSKESLNIAIRRDTEISNNGSSNVLNVIIKQKKNSSTSTKSINSPKSLIENHCSKNCDTKSLEKLFVENYLEKISKNTDKNRSKHLREAECQTEDNVLHSDSKDRDKNQALAQVFDLSNITLQNEFRNFLTYHFKNLSPGIWRSNAVDKNNDEKEILEAKPTFQHDTDTTKVRKKFLNHSQQFIHENSNSLTQENHCTKLSPCVHNTETISCCINKPETLSCSKSNLETVSCSENNCNCKINKFINILDNEEKPVKKSNCENGSDFSKVNTFYELREANENRANSKLNEITFDNKCKKTESEDIAEKLRNIGLSDKKSFLKVIHSNNQLETLATKEDPSVILKFKPIRSPWIEKDIISKSVGLDMKKDIKNVTTRKQKSKFSVPQNIISHSGKNENSKISNLLYTKVITPDFKKENSVMDKHNNITDTNNMNLNNFMDLQGTSNFKPADNLKLEKQNFINVLSTDEEKKDMIPQIRELAKNIFEATRKTSYGNLEDFIVPEVQTKTCDILSVPYKNVSHLKKVHNSNVIPKNVQDIKEEYFIQNKPDLLNSNKIENFIHIDSVGILPEEKRSFIHVINKDNTDMYLNKNRFLEKNIQVDFLENEDGKQVNTLRRLHEDKQIVDKINALYEFLQYLDKMLKGKSTLKLGVNITNTNTIGHFNNTLRCLCNNCMEILNKIEGNKMNNFKEEKSPENITTHPVNESFFPREAIGEANNKHLPKVTSSPSGQYVASNELEINDIAATIKLNDAQVNPFYVIVTQEEKALQHSHNDFIKKIKRNQIKKVSENVSSYDFREKSYEDFVKEKFKEMVDIKSMEKTAESTCVCEGKTNFDHIRKDERFCNKIQPSSSYSRKPLLEHSFEPVSMLNQVHESKYEPHDHDIKSPQINYYKNNETSKLKFAECRKNVHNKLNPDSFHGKGGHGKFSNVICDSLKPALGSSKNTGFKNKVSFSYLKNDNQQCFINKNISPGMEIDDLSNENYDQITNYKILSEETGTNVGFCNELIIQNSQIMKPNKRVWLPKIKSSFRIPFRKDGKNLPHSKLDKKTLLGNSVTLSKTQLNVKNRNFDFNAMSKDRNTCAKCRRNSFINNDIHQNNKQTSQVVHKPLSNIHSPHGSIIIIKRNLQKEKALKGSITSNSVEYLNSSHQCINGNENIKEDKELDSDGWVPIKDITETENNQIYLGMDIKDMTVKHVEYVQKFPKNPLHCKTITENKET